MLYMTDEIKARCQEIFDAVWRGAERQGWRRSEDGSGHCVNVNLWGRMCGVALAGHFIGLSENGIRDLSNTGIQWVVGIYVEKGQRILNQKSIEDRVTKNPTSDFTDELRETHDDAMGDWKQRMIEFAKRWKLNVPEQIEES